MNAKEMLESLAKEPELIPDEHDGSYEIMRATIDAYSKMEDWDIVDYTDLDLIYFMAVGTFSDGLEKKKTRVRTGHLPKEEKEQLLSIMDKVWENVTYGKYNNDAVSAKSSQDEFFFFGMFGTGFHTFSQYKSKEWDKQICEFIKMLVDIKDLKDDNEIYDRAETILNQPIKGLQAASVSIILHCLKPYTFPIINGNEGMGSCFGQLGVPLVRSKTAETYIENCRKIKQFRDANLPFKNYRVIDLWTRKIAAKEKEDLWPTLEEYPYILTKEQWIEFLSKDRINNPETLKMLFCMLELGGEATCKKLSQVLGQEEAAYISRGANLGKRVKNAYNLPPVMDGDVERTFAIPFRGHYVKDDEGANKLYSWVLRDELKEALIEINESINEDDEVKKSEFDHNAILYGPPGTGKTYNSAIYAVAICDELTLDEVKNWEYQDVLKRYDELKEENRIAFTTFHQSYGYEEFIEGIRPNVDEDNTNGISYRREDGIFKKFCKDANKPVLKGKSSDYGINENPRVWKVSLSGTGDNEVRTECMENDHIRIGWDEYGEVITDDNEYFSGGKAVLDSFYNKMRKGDIVLSCYSSEITDAIGVITGEPEWIEDYEYYRRVRKVKWLVKGIRENILKLNNDKVLTLSSVYKLNIPARSILDIVTKYSKETIEEETQKNFVFIIDEINRGNISKIFGELITLIEDTKRLGADEAMQAQLPYSKEPFGVPSNVYILGTMNTADRSIALMDTALRRRFSFIEMMPNPSVLTGIEVKDNSESVDIAKLLEVINQRIECLFDREHTIGHAFFTKLRENPSVEVLGTIFKKSVVPLLQEYFYEDYEKIRLVLGDNGKKDESIEFVTKKEFDTKIFRSGNVEDLPDDKPIYHINNDAFDNILSYKGIF